MPCDLCKRNFKISRAIFPYGGKLAHTCVACLGKYKLEPDEDNSRDYEFNFYPAKRDKNTEPRMATKAEAIKYLLGIK